MSPGARTQHVKLLARQLGFDLVGVTLAQPSNRKEYYRDWLADGYGGTMEYLKRNVHLRANPARLLPGARSIVCVGLGYKRSDGYHRPGAGETPRTAGAPPTGRVAQYARGHDYHTVLRGLLATLTDHMRATLPESFVAQAFVDTGPLLERELAAAAGLGWIGKNTCLVHPRLGSYLFLGELVSTLDLQPDEPLADGCSRCRRCLEACPTGALTSPHCLDASRCISYLTIEHRGSIPEDIRARMGDWVFGCDACQQVCPYNAHAPLTRNSDLARDRLPAHLDLRTLANMSSGDYRRLTRHSAGRRVSRGRWQGNALAVLARVSQ